MEVIVYTTPTCPWCKRAKEYLQNKGVKYKEINVAEDRNAAAEMISKSGQRGVPVIDIDGNIVVGFDREKIDNLLQIK